MRRYLLVRKQGDVIEFIARKGNFYLTMNKMSPNIWTHLDSDFHALAKFLNEAIRARTSSMDLMKAVYDLKANAIYSYPASGDISELVFEYEV